MPEETKTIQLRKINEDLVWRAKRRAVYERITLTRFIERALRIELERVEKVGIEGSTSYGR